jgi:hypothetical protein
LARPGREFFTDDLAHYISRENFALLAHMRLERFVDQGLVSLPGLVSLLLNR